MRRLALAAALLAPFAAAAQPAPGPYAMTGTNADGSPYSGAVLVIDRGAGMFQVEWVVSGQRISGWGMGRGDAFAASYVLDGQVGIVLYQRQGEVWRGIWSVADGAPGTEDLRRR
jgi:hypothetical protein